MDASWTLHVLGTGDVARLRALTDLFADAFDQRDDPAHVQQSDDALRKLLAAENFVAIVAECQREVVGGLTGYVLPRPNRVAPEFYLYDLAVAEAHRRRGIATALIGCCVQVARSRGAGVVFVQAHPEDEGAVALYEALGERTEVLHFDIPTVRGRPAD